MKHYLIGFVVNLALLLVFGIAFYVLFPDTMAQVFQIYDGLFGPALIIVLIIAAALPRKSRRRR